MPPSPCQPDVAAQMCVDDVTAEHLRSVWSLSCHRPLGPREGVGSSTHVTPSEKGTLSRQEQARPSGSWLIEVPS